mgnify:CR=1 FL=1
MIGNGGGVLEPLRLDKHDLQLCGRMDINHLVPAFFGMGRRVLAHISAAIVAGDKVDVLVVIILILRDPDKVLEFIHDSH